MTFPTDRVPNRDTIAAWNGADGAYWARHAEHFDLTMRGHHARFMAAAAIRPGERILDIGCGNGETSCDAALIAGSVLGVDVSVDMLAQARSRAAARRLTNVTFVRADAQTAAFGAASADVAISRTGAMFFDDPEAAFANIGSALRPGGRLVLLVWQSAPRNEWFSALAGAVGLGKPDPPPGVPGPFSLADPESAEPVLAAAGFTSVAFESIEAPMCFGADAASAAEFVGRMGFVSGTLRSLDDAARTAASTRLSASIHAHESPDGVTYGSAAWLITASWRAS